MKIDDFTNCMIQVKNKWGEKQWQGRRCIEVDVLWYSCMYIQI